MEHPTQSIVRMKPTEEQLKVLAIFATMLIGAALGGCVGTAKPVSVRSACDVFTDSLRDVHATNDVGEDRISKHFESGIAAGCWRR